VNGRWRVDLTRSARRELRNLADGPRQAALDLIEELAEQGPVLAEGIKMRRYVETWRVRFHNDF
jgi:mRNA-degrading endonuclease RelE of RelBE toxin-antitoxin system